MATMVTNGDNGTIGANGASDDPFETMMIHSELEGHSDQGKHAKSWAMINTIKGKTPSFTGNIKGNSPEERVT